MSLGFMHLETTDPLAFETTYVKLQFIVKQPDMRCHEMT